MISSFVCVGTKQLLQMPSRLNPSQSTMYTAEDHYKNGNFKLAESALRELLRKQEELVEESAWSRTRGDLEMSQAYFLLAEVLNSLSEFSLAESVLHKLLCKQEKLMSDGTWKESQGDLEMYQTYSLLAKVMNSLSKYGSAYNFSKNAYSLLVKWYPSHYSIVKKAEYLLNEYQQRFLDGIIERNRYKIALAA